MGTISGFTYEPDFDAGFFDEGVGTLYPQTINLAMEYTVNHTHQLCWGPEGTREANFPYVQPVTGAEGGSAPGGVDPVEAEAAEGETTS